MRKSVTGHREPEGKIIILIQNKSTSGVDKRTSYPSKICAIILALALQHRNRVWLLYTILLGRSNGLCFLSGEKTIRVMYSLLCRSPNGLCQLLYLRRKIASRLGKNGKRVCLPCLSSLTACKLSGQFIIRPSHRTDSIHHCT